MVSSDRPVKIVVLGDGMVGKTCLLMTYTSGHYPSEYVPTVFENYLGSVKVDGKALAFELWDTAGQEEYSHLRPLSYPNTDVIILCFSIVRLSSLENAEKKWCREISQSEHLRGKPIILVGTMSDLREEVTKVNASSVITYEKKLGRGASGCSQASTFLGSFSVLKNAKSFPPKALRNGLVQWNTWNVPPCDQVASMRCSTRHCNIHLHDARRRNHSLHVHIVLCCRQPERCSWHHRTMSSYRECLSNILTLLLKPE
ncbi:hypothetical protein CRM22_007657 [Opisthorchis felineus]|uniref:Uncharacterized protein n=1 Tax=Opisthorchis felineus TaxID=147828 RepID=A0A4S2LLR3_OPIFE|nr:hypothetical protein CRM22_007657 [Opisthorchis felineus]